MSKKELSEDAMQEGAEDLLQDTRIMQTWKQSKKASNKVRDDMLKLGTHWNVARNVNQTKAPAVPHYGVEGNYTVIVSKLSSTAELVG